jgi:hypothetical protein
MASSEGAEFGDPGIEHTAAVEPVGASYQPTCSCGFRAPLTHDTESGAMRAAEAHAAASRPRRPGRYTATLENGAVTIYCAQHPAKPLLSFPAPIDDHQAAMTEAIRDHDWEYHDDDRVI